MGILNCISFLYEPVTGKSVKLDRDEENLIGTLTDENAKLKGRLTNVSEKNKGLMEQLQKYKLQISSKKHVKPVKEVKPRAVENIAQKANTNPKVAHPAEDTSMRELEGTATSTGDTNMLSIAQKLRKRFVHYLSHSALNLLDPFPHPLSSLQLQAECC